MLEHPGRDADLVGRLALGPSVGASRFPQRPHDVDGQGAVRGPFAPWRVAPPAGIDLILLRFDLLRGWSSVSLLRTPTRGLGPDGVHVRIAVWAQVARLRAVREVAIAARTVPR